jgi:hypothetical protein
MQDHENCSMTARHGLRIVVATREKVTRRPLDLLAALVSALAA